MLEANARVLLVEADWAWVETQPQSACGHCGAGACSGSVLAGLFAARPSRFRLPNRLGLQPGQQVIIGLPERMLVGAALRAYLAPLLPLLLVVGLAQQAGLAAWLQALLAVLALLAGLALVGRGGLASGRYLPRLLRLAPASVPMPMQVPIPPINSVPTKE